MPSLLDPLGLFDALNPLGLVTKPAPSRARPVVAGRPAPDQPPSPFALFIALVKLAEAPPEPNTRQYVQTLQPEKTWRFR